MTDSLPPFDKAQPGSDVDRTELLRQIDALKEQVAARDHFIGIAANQLRSPMHSLGLQIAAVQAMADRRGDRQISERLMMASRNLQWLVLRCEVLLGVSRMATSSRGLKVGWVNLREAIQRSSDLLLPQANASNATFHIECDGQIVGEWDSLALDQILGNLISNAIKFGEGSQVVVSAEDSGAGLVTLRVSDLGSGIAEADQQRVFQRFEELLATTDDLKGGFGLGLWLTRHLVEAHSGSISIRSSPGSGATFTVTLPKTAPNTNGVDRRSSPDRRAGPARP